MLIILTVGMDLLCLELFIYCYVVNSPINGLMALFCSS